jgi:uncharacterized protein with HEPN domain
VNDRDRDSLCDVILAARAAREFRGSGTMDEFLADRKSQSAVLHQLLVLGEAVKRLSPEFVSGVDDVPWRDIARMRDKLIHHYEGIDAGRIWGVVEHDLPALLQQLEPLLPEDSSGENC